MSPQWVYKLIGEGAHTLNNSMNCNSRIMIRQYQIKCSSNGTKINSKSSRGNPCRLSVKTEGERTLPGT